MSSLTFERPVQESFSGSMFRFAVGQMRLSLPRLVAGGLAVAIGAAFVAATLLSGTIMRETARNAVSAKYAQADLAIDEQLSPRQLTAVSRVAGVASVGAGLSTWGDLKGPQGLASLPLSGLVADPALQPQKLVTGAWPTGDQIALPESAAERLGVGVGGHVEKTLVRTEFYKDKQGQQQSREAARKDVTLTVSGLTADPKGAFRSTGGQGLVPLATMESWSTYELGPPVQLVYDSALVRTAPGADPVTVRAAAQQAIDALGRKANPYGNDTPVPQVRTVQEAQDEDVATLTGDTRIVTVVLLAFASIAMIVAAMVIANTFQVLVAQRTQTLALLRCVGALKRQLRRSVVIEALLVGLGSSVVGVLGGIALAQVALQVLRRFDVAQQLPGSVTPGWPVIVLPILVGTLVTLLASLAPARAATRVAPLAALRPDAGPQLRERAGKVRLAFSILLILSGGLLMAAGVVGGRMGAPAAGLLVGILGGAVSFLGVLLGSVFWVPRLTGGVSGLMARSGAPAARLAAANSVRNPRRTAATATALLIGVTLVSMMATGAASARASLSSQLDTNLLTDILVQSVDQADPSKPVPALTAAQVKAVEGVSGVTAARIPISAPVNLRRDAGDDSESGNGTTAIGISVADARVALRSAAVADALADGKVVVGAGATLSPDGSGERPTTLQVQSSDGTWRPIRVAYVLDDNQAWAIMSPQLLRQIAPQAAASMAFLRVDPDADPTTVSEDVTDAVSKATPSGSVPAVESAVVERDEYDKAINGVLAVVLGLLGISVVIAVVGVANTLSLSVIERRRESATLRTIGLTRRQLRWTLALEGMVLAAVGAACGIVLGVLYGWVGTTTVLGDGVGGYATLELQIPWWQLGLVLLVALLAGLLASVLPSRSAAKASPVAALATT
ncbi:ABC transporter permease [Spongisporangium articulatum]|uniref:ABC transporter permease n=1 Tax=Spongisporangium articulatum TaxID=3362603 RepID=A0ABW8AJT3_9ACTN